ncbi:hypothetical protein MOC27_11030 [Bacillus inaquosorum]|uniref:Uncharacterized protein n=1 Tax=Bacillus vallismortis TaxID=72361 RepID=A0AAP3CLW7_BACVA|nr:MULTISPECIES: hypothetical protein [Bacillus]MCY8685596.1 hypothetical protein [Bacillus spizizenii]MCY8250273.1 hypothetical protein [Bacillus inaquosorum]MCY8318762.1 hypothetical protein [Bacillus vallismortis]MCY8706320.1 hypothetical protein [Bacillus inaquosorum]MCY9235794.1 hypothetical protein [Bacillus spizizenii]
MASLTIYRLNTADQLDLFFSHEGKLNLDEVIKEMKKKSAPIDNDGKTINGEGFINTRKNIRNGLPVIESYCTSLVNLGNYFEARLENDQLTTVETQHRYFSKASLIITNESDLILKFDNSTEERSKSRVKSLVEELGFEANALRLDNDLLRKIQQDPIFEWSAVKIDKIDKDGDRTQRVSYEIDLADDKHPSRVDDDYRNHGKMSHIKFQLPYSAKGAPNKVTVKLYNQGNRIVIDEEELCGSSLMDFVVYLMSKLKGIKEEEV